MIRPRQLVPGQSIFEPWSDTRRGRRGRIGDYLLNVGPTKEGLIPEPSVERLEDIGKWMEVNSESIYGTQASPFPKLEWGRCTQKKHGNGTTLYLHVFEWPTDGKLLVPGLENQVESAALLANNEKLEFKKNTRRRRTPSARKSPRPERHRHQTRNRR